MYFITDTVSVESTVINDCVPIKYKNFIYTNEEQVKSFDWFKWWVLWQTICELHNKYVTHSPLCSKLAFQSFIVWKFSADRDSLQRHIYTESVDWRKEKKITLVCWNRFIETFIVDSLNVNLNNAKYRATKHFFVI